MSPSSTPMRDVHRGTVAASAILIDRRLCGEAEARRRVLALWRDGAQTFRVESGYLIRFRRAVWIDCRTAPGLVFTLAGQSLASFPAAESQLAPMALPPEAMVMRVGAKTVALALGEAVNPAEWLDVSDWQPLADGPLGAPPKPVAVVIPPPAADTRQVLSRVPAPDPQLAQVLAAFRQSGRQKPPSDKWLGVLQSRLARWLGRAATGWAQAAAPASVAAPKPSSRLAQKLWRRLKTAVLQSRLATLYGWRQAAYLNRMMRMFDEGRLDDALRHAIPLGEGEIATLEEVSLGVPQARQSLRFGVGSADGAAAIPLPEELMDELRRMYRMAYDRLARQEKFAEAAFVLAELLGEKEEAVAFLERQGLTRLAAELAEACRLDPSLATRLWWQAGDAPRAALLAKRHNAYADAVHWLEQRDSSAAARLRLLWATELAKCGDYAQATEAIWPVAGARNLAATWIRLTLEAGGRPAGRMLARYLRLVPEDAESVLPRIRALLDDEGSETLAARLSFADELAQAAASPVNGGVLRATARMLIREAARGAASDAPKILKRLYKQPGMAALRADAPPLPKTVGAAAPLEWRIAAGDRGTLRIWDVAHLPTGLTLVALGERGARLVGPRGATVTHFNQPTHQLVVSDNGSYAIGVARRGRIKRLARFNLIERRAQDWDDAELDAFAADFDGQRWFVASRGDVLMADATSPLFEALWRIPEVGAVASMARNPQWLGFLCGVAGDAAARGSELYQYALPALRLFWRGTVEVPEERLVYAQSPAAQVVFDLREQCYPLRLAHGWDDYPIFERYAAARAAAMRSRIASRQPPEWAAVGFLERDGAQLVGDGSFFAVALRDEEAMHIEARDTSGGVLAWVQLEKTRHIALRWQDPFLSLGDEHGRVVVFDAASRQIARSFRL